MRKNQIFISYRRNGGFETAKHLRDLLVNDGYRVTFDIDSFRRGAFDIQLYEKVDECKDFILIVDAHAFDRCLNEKNAGHKEDDWMRCELSRALEKGKNIVPVFLSGVNSIPKGLPDDISKVQYLNGLTANHEYFDEFYRRLKTFLHDDRPRGKVWLAVLVVGVLVGAIIIMCYLNKKYPMQSSIIVIPETPSPDTTRLKEKDNLAVITRDTTKAKQNPRSADVPSINISPKSIEKPKPVRADLKPEEGKLSVKKTQSHSVERQTDLRVYDIEDLVKLAKSGDARAYIPLAKYYFKNAAGMSSYEKVHVYATKAIAANVDVVEAKKLICAIEALGFYENNDKYNKPIF